MTATIIRRLQGLPDQLLANLDRRDVAVWLMPSFVASAGVEATAKVLGLPWSMVLSEAGGADLIAALEVQEDPDEPLVRRRGLIHVIDANPADVTLPRRSLPVYLLNGRDGGQASALQALTRRLTMLEEIGRRSVRQLIVLAGSEAALPTHLAELWSEGTRLPITVISDDPAAGDRLKAWGDPIGLANIWLIPTDAAGFASLSVDRYLAGRDGRLHLRIRDSNGANRTVDVTGADDPEHPILGRYEVISDAELVQLGVDDLQAQEVQDFFHNPASSWRPYAAGMPWDRAPDARNRLLAALRKLDHDGPLANRIFFVRAESGAGATTFLRDVAWRAAGAGYPTLLAGQAPFVPSSLELIAYLDKVGSAVAESVVEEDPRLYQAPVLIVFDGHWDGREDQLVRFAREFERSGRRACFLITVGPYTPTSAFDDSRFSFLTELTHEISSQEAEELGRHLNTFLTAFGGVRSASEWRRFYEATSVSLEADVAAFWIALSFWLQRQFDMQETIQSWVYRKFKDAAPDLELRAAIVSIAAFSTERLSLPDAMLPQGKQWPLSDRLSDLQGSAGALGLIRVRGERARYWALIHDILGRFILTALFYDYEARAALGFETAQNPEHLRFQALCRLSGQSVLERPDLREIADAFAVSIFKIDPAHGHSTFAPYWREVLDALDEMPRSLRTTSRTFLHHSAVSRRRIAKDGQAFHLTHDERAELLARAVADIEAALDIGDDGQGDSDLSLLNSLAHAYHDLAEAEAARGGDPRQVTELQERAREATRQAFRLNPDNSFVIETYARTLLSEARTYPERAAANAIEVLSIVYGATLRTGSDDRRRSLGRLANDAFDILLESSADLSADQEPRTESEAIVRALRSLAQGVDRFEGMDLRDYPAANRICAAELLAVSELTGNAQAVRLRYMLVCLDQEFNFALQLELLQSLASGGPALSPQLQLEYAVLLHQRDRHHEADQLFRDLRRLWRREEHFVEVPRRLRWLLLPDSEVRRQVHARVTASGEGRYFASVQEFQNGSVVFRPFEFGQQIRPGIVLRGLVNFGHNGPFLRPLTAQ